MTGSALPTLGARKLSQPRGRPPADHPVLGSLAMRSTPRPVAAMRAAGQRLLPRLDHDTTAAGREPTSRQRQGSLRASPPAAGPIGGMGLANGTHAEAARRCRNAPVGSVARPGLVTLEPRYADDSRGKRDEPVRGLHLAGAECVREPGHGQEHGQRSRKTGAIPSLSSPGVVTLPDAGPSGGVSALARCPPGKSRRSAAW